MSYLKKAAVIAALFALVAAPSLVVTPAATAKPFAARAIIACESGGDPRAQNKYSSASGLYQFIDSTWRAYRGDSTASRAAYASVREQHAAAYRLFADQGYKPWSASKSCWSQLI
ncbi:MULTISPECIES: transglycosylase family protein [unclassified Pseudonocardia]|uniref:transglycosylase family protein n=1 Tax=unclassified Pseudonocardia TaxID=2619320 RepID=UPI001CF60E7F|nr:MULTISPECIES: transglycosylase family protein [unclassified Pseudonocardia]